MGTPDPGPEHHPADDRLNIGRLSTGGGSQANRPRHPGFRRCHAPYCRISRTRTVWPSEYRIATGWGLVHLACRPSPRQTQMLRMMAAMGKAARTLTHLQAPIRRATQQLQRAYLAGQFPHDHDA
jgi:hypothetical protein